MRHQSTTPAFAESINLHKHKEKLNKGKRSGRKLV